MHWQKETYPGSVNYYMPLGVPLFFLADVEAAGSCLPSLFALWKLISLNGAGLTSFLLMSFHMHAPEVTAAFSVLPILTYSSTLNNIAAAWLQHDPSLKFNRNKVNILAAPQFYDRGLKVTFVLSSG